MKTKICSKCNIKKSLSEFHKDKSKLDGYRPDCKECVIKRTQKYYFINIKEIREKNNIYSKNYYRNNKEKRQQYIYNLGEKIVDYQTEYYKKNKKYFQNYGKDYRKINKEKIKEYRNNKYNTDINFKIKVNLRHRIYMALKNNYKTKKTLELLGCTVEHLKKHLKSRFAEEMTWDNYGKWHIDHIKPCSKFDLSKPEEQKVCFHYTNLQPLWEIDNLKKSDNII